MEKLDEKYLLAEWMHEVETRINGLEKDIKAIKEIEMRRWQGDLDNFESGETKK